MLGEPGTSELSSVEEYVFSWPFTRVNMVRSYASRGFSGHGNNKGTKGHGSTWEGQMIEDYGS